MKQDRRTLLRYFAGALVGGLLVRWNILIAQVEQDAGTQGLLEVLPGTWKLRSYTYTSDNRTYSSPDEMEATANFDGSNYSVEFATYIGAVGIRRTRRASESGTFTVDGDQIQLKADEASSDSELGEEMLLEVKIEDDVMSLVSNNGSNQEVWEKVSG